MKAPRICVAGIDPSTLEHVRPTTQKSDLITRAMLRSEGGPFGPGALVDIGYAEPDGQRPEVEDHRFATARARHVRDLSDEHYWNILGSVRHDGVSDAFGPELGEVRPRKFAIPAGQGIRSLAVVEVEAPELYVDSWGKLFLDMADDGLHAKLRVTDARFYEPDHATVRSKLVEDVSRRLRDGVPVYAMLGLARAMNDEDGGSVHWLQCNGLCLADRASSDMP
jgi:hypothetical protein